MITPTLVCLAIAVAVFLLVICLLSKWGKGQELKKQRLQGLDGTVQTAEKKERVPLKQRLRASKEKRERKARLQGTEKKGKKDSPVQRQLDMIDSPLSAGAFAVIRLVVAFAFGAGAYFGCQVLGLEPKMVLLASIAALLVGAIIPSRILTSKVSARQNAIRLALPDTIDLLVVSVEAGLGFDSALTRLYESDKSPLMEELMAATRDIQHGVSKKEAYTEMSKRCDVKELTTFANALLQAEELGTSVKSVLNSQALALRENRRRTAEEKALKAPVTMMIPMVLFIFPVILIILMGPAAMSLMEMFG